MQAPAVFFTIGVGAFFFAFTTISTAVCLMHKLRFAGKTFGIVAPYAAKRTALEKDSSSKSGAVVHRHFFNIKNDSVHYTVYA
jgi:hypothetical protein